MDYAAARHNMVESQIRTNQVTDPSVVAAMDALPRELFVPKQLRGIAYVDEDLDLGNGRYLMEPMVLARLLQAAEIRSTDVVLDVGCGTGYSTAVLARMASAVVALECDAELAARAGGLLAELGADNAAVVTGPLAEGYTAQAPYDVIVLGGAVAEPPPALCSQLADGGRLMAIVAGNGTGVGKATVTTRTAGTFSRRIVFDAATPLLPGFAPDLGFVF